MRRVVPLLLLALSAAADEVGVFKSEPLNFEIRLPEDSVDWEVQEIDQKKYPNMRVWYQSDFADSDAYATIIIHAQKMAGKIVRNGPLAVRFAMESVLRGRSLPVDEAMRYERNLFGLVSSTADMREGLSAFLDKRQAEFKNE